MIARSLQARLKPAGEAGRARVLVRREWVGGARGLVPLLVLTTVGVADGGFLPRTWRLATIALLALAGAALLARDRIAVSRLEGGVLAALAGLAAWTAASGWWGRPSTSHVEAERDVVYLAAVLAVVVVAERRSLTQLVVGTLGGITGVCAYGLGKYLIAPPPLDPSEGKLLFQPLGYANALGIFAAIGIVLSVGLALAARERRARAATLAPLAVLVPTLYFTSSRGAVVGLAIGLVAVLCAAGRLSGRAVAVATLTLALVAAAVFAASSGARARIADDNRPDYWKVAWTDFERNPGLGSGAGTFSDYWLHYREIDSFARDAHNLYIESLAELGPLGLALVLLALGLPLVRLRGRRDPVLAAAAGGYVAFVVHAGLDWDWEVPAVTLAGLFCGAALLVGGRPDGLPPLSGRARLALLLVALALGVLAAVRLETGPASPIV